jgi:membrane protein DedA with SNARE-associated domain
MDDESISQEVKQGWPKKVIYLGAAAVVFTIAACVAAIYYKDALADIANIGGYSLLGVAVIAFIAGSTLSFVAIPIPYWLLVFTLPSILEPQWGLLAPVAVGLTSALGTALGHLPTFMIGYGGGSLSQKFGTMVNNRFYTRAIDWARKNGSWAVFAMSAMINPIHLPMTIAIGALRYPPPKFFLFSLLGNMVKSLVIAFCGYFGLSSLFQFIGF